jgi:tungstate transport system ATP-binding protein
MPEAASDTIAVPCELSRDARVLPLEARGLVFEIQGRRLIEAVDLALTAGMRTVVMGANGAGKSVLLRLLHGLLKPTAGQVLWAGRPGDGHVARRQAMVFQRPVLLRRSAAANIRYALSVAGVSRAECEHRLQEVLGLANLAHLAHSPARALSGGEQQRLAIARALSTRPEVLFLDEPTASLDPASTLAVEKLIQAADRDGTKIVLVTHDPGQARRLADEVVFIHNGRLAECTPVQAFFERPRSEVAAAFLEGKILL